MYKKNITLDEFTNELMNNVQEILKQKYDIEAEPHRQMSLKTNVELETVCFKFPDSPAAPSVYPEDLYLKQYQNGDSIETIAEQTADIVYGAYKMSPPIPEMTTDQAREHITLSLVNTAKNGKLLSEVPSFKVAGGELSAIPRWEISDNASFIVTNKICSNLMLTPDEVLQMGQHNIDSGEYEVKTMKEVLSGQMGIPVDDMPDVGPDMVVLSVPSHVRGAKALLSDKALQEVHERVGGDFVILPSSTHEVICIPAEGMDANALRAMVNEVNTTVLDEQDFLSSNIMIFKGNKLELVGESLNPITKVDDISIDDDMGFSM
jgi:hypothetical protein